MEVPVELIEAAEQTWSSGIVNGYSDNSFFRYADELLGGRLAPMTAVHGVLVDVYGIGVLITGKSGVGKSETALELVKRGHRLVADDLVEIREVAKNVLIGNPPKLT